MKVMKSIFFLAIAGLLLVSCYPEGPEETDDLDAVGTFFDTDFNFGNVNSYFLPDTLVEVGDPSEASNVGISDSWEDLIINQVAMNMNELGYSRVDDPTQADVWVNASATVTVNSGYYYDYWHYWGGYYDPFYPSFYGGGFYPGYYPSYPIVTGYSYTTGTVLINMQDSRSFNEDVQNGDDDAQLEGVWVAAINGLVSGEVTQERVERTIDQAFDQSPYLGQ